MRCRDVEHLIIAYASGLVTSPEAADHIAGCERCRRLAQALGESPEIGAPQPEQLKQIEAGMIANLKSVRAVPPARVLWSAVMVCLVVVAAAGVLLLGIAGWRALGPFQRIAVFSALAASASLLAFSTIKQIVPGSKILLLPSLLVAGLIAGFTGLFAALLHPEAETAFVSEGLGCLRIGLECALAASVLLWLLLRRGAVFAPMATGAMAGMLAGLSGLTVLEIFCPNLNAYHVLAWHLGAVLASTLAGLAIGIAAEYSSSSRFGRSH